MSNAVTVNYYLERLKKTNGTAENGPPPCRSYFRTQAKYIELVKSGLTVMFDAEIANQICTVLERNVQIEFSVKLTAVEQSKLLSAIVEHTLSILA